MKKRSGQLLLLLVVGPLLAACLTVAPETAAGPTTITFYKRGYVDGGADITSATNAKAVEMFEQRHPGIEVDIVGVPWTLEGDAQLLAALESGREINVFSVNPSDLIQFAREGKVPSIDPFLTDQDRADFYASGLQAAAVDGQVYAWPIWVTASSIFANEELLAERSVESAAIDDLWTWDEFVEAAKQLTYQRSDGAPVCGFTVSSDWRTSGFYPIFYIDGGRILSPDGQLFDIEANTEVIRDAAGQPTAVISIIRDITQRKQVENELHSLTRRLELYLKQSLSRCTLKMPISGQSSLAATLSRC